MSKYFLFLVLLCSFISCSNKENTKQDDKYEIRKIYIETINFSDSTLSKLRAVFTDRADTIYNFYRNDSSFIIYKFKDASELPISNLLNGTRKINFRLYDERDSIGNPYYSFSLYESENSEWKRVYNFGRTSFYQDTLIDEDFILQEFIHRLNFRTWKGLP